MPLFSELGGKRSSEKQIERENQIKIGFLAGEEIYWRFFFVFIFAKIISNFIEQISRSNI